MPTARSKPTAAPTNLELFPKAPPSPAVLTVSQLNHRARLLLEQRFARVLVAGEVSNLKSVGGHVYFTLKDRNAQLPAALFQREAARLGFELRDGLEVVVTGRLTLYGRYGRYQIVAEQVEPRGAGALQAAFETLKAKLAKEGLFDAERKRRLPTVPRGVAVVASPTGAVIRDIVHVAERRFPGCRIVLIPARVQGQESAMSIAAAIRRGAQLCRRADLDVLVLARGGGSMEDLWGFNEERVARAIVTSPVPVVSAVGHETDFTITDFVADLRAPTPSAAAELIFPRRSDLHQRLNQALERGRRAYLRALQERRQRLRAVQATLGDGRVLVREQQQRLAYLRAALESGGRHRLSQQRLQLHQNENRLVRLHPRTQLRELRARFEHHIDQFALLARQHVVRRRARLEGAMGRLDALSPLGVLQRGYAIALDVRGQAVRDARTLSAGDAVELRVARGAVRTRVEEVFDPAGVDVPSGSRRS